MIYVYVYITESLTLLCLTRIIPSNLLKIMTGDVLVTRTDVPNYGTDSVTQVVYYIPRWMIAFAILYESYEMHMC